MTSFLVWFQRMDLVYNLLSGVAVQCRDCLLCFIAVVVGGSNNVVFIGGVHCCFYWW